LRIPTGNHARHLPDWEPSRSFFRSCYASSSATSGASPFEEALFTANEAASHSRTREAGSSSSGARSEGDSMW